MNPTSGSDILSYRGNAALGLNTEGLSSYGETDANFINQAVTNFQLKQFEKNKTIYEQKVKQRDATLAQIASGELDIPEVFPEDREELMTSLDAVKKVLLDNNGDVNSNIQTSLQYKDALAKWREKKVLATHKFVELNRQAAEIAQTTRPDLQKDYQNHYNSERKQKLGVVIKPYQHMLDYRVDGMLLRNKVVRPTLGIPNAQYDAQGNTDVTQPGKIGVTGTGGAAKPVTGGAAEFYDMLSSKTDKNFNVTTTGLLNYGKILSAVNSEYLQTEGTGSFYETQAFAKDVLKNPQLVERINKSVQDYLAIVPPSGYKDILPEAIAIQRDAQGNILTDNEGNVLTTDSPAEIRAKFNLTDLRPTVSQTGVDEDAAKVAKTKAEINKLNADAQSNRMKAAGYADAQRNLGRKYAMQTKRLEQDAMPKEYFDEVQEKAFIGRTAAGNDVIRVKWGDLQAGAQQALGIKPMTAGREQFVNGTLNAYNANGPVSDDVVIRRYKQAVKEQDFKGNVFDYLKKYNVDYEFEVIGRENPGKNNEVDPTKISRSGRLTSFTNQNEKRKKNDVFLKDGDMPQESENE